MRGFLLEFQKFAMRGNVFDMAVGIVIGAAFGKIVNSLVENVIMPPIGLIVGGSEFAELALSLGEGRDRQPVVLKYGLFLQTVVDFLLIAFAIFLLVKGINAAREAFEERQEREEQAKGPPQPTEEIMLLREIRDALTTK